MSDPSFEVSLPCGLADLDLIAFPAAELSTLGKPSLADKSACGWDMGSLIVWVEGNICNKPLPEDVPFEGVSYNNPNGGTSIFSYS